MTQPANDANNNDANDANHATNHATNHAPIDCVACGEQHPRHLSVTVTPPGLSCGLDCMTETTRRLLGLPDPQDAATGIFPTPPSLEGWEDKPSKYFMVSLAFPSEESQLEDHHFRRALNRIGLARVLRGGYSDPKATVTLNIDGTNVRFNFSAYTATRQVNIWIEGFTDETEPKLVGAARLSWAEDPQRPERRLAHRAAARFLSEQAA